MSVFWAPRPTFAAILASGLLAAVPATAEDIMLPIAPGKSAGTVLMPKAGFTGTGVVIVAGSGPTDRNGNQRTLVNNSLKMLAEALSNRGIATARYDKRFAGRTQISGYREKDVRFDHFVDDAVVWARHLAGRPAVKRIAFIGHSQGGLVATLAATRVGAGKLVLLASPGFNIARTLKRQFAAAIPNKESRRAVFAVIDRLRRGEPATGYGGLARRFFRPSIQPFLMSWMKHDPAERLKAFAGSVLIVHGTRDLQVKSDEAARLQQAKPAAALVTVQGMNHVLKAPAPGRPANVAAYRRPDAKLADGLVESIARFLTGQR